MFGKLGKTSKVQRFVGHSSQEEQNMAATVKLYAHNQKETDSLYKAEIFL
jgi:GTPase SAR1 family protein